MTLNIDVLWDNPNEWNLACLLSKCFLLRYIWSQLHTSSVSSAHPLCCGAVRAGGGGAMGGSTERHQSPPPTLGTLAPLSHCCCFYSVLICSPSLSCFFFLSFPSISVPLLLVHQHLAFKTRRVFPLVSELTGRSREVAVPTLFNTVFAGVTPCSQCLFSRLRLSICFHVPWRLAARWWTACLSQGKSSIFWEKTPEINKDPPAEITGGTVGLSCRLLR